jgi:hypothetical protein
VNERVSAPPSPLPLSPTALDALIYTMLFRASLLNRFQYKKHQTPK